MFTRSKSNYNVRIGRILIRRCLLKLGLSLEASLDLALGSVGF